MPLESSLCYGRDADASGLIETMRVEADGSVLRLDRHLARLSRSAAALGIALDEARARCELLAAASQCDTPGRQRLRLHLRAEGALTIATAPFHLQDEATVWRLALARERLDSHDRLRAHKSDRRGLYERARAEHDPSQIDEVLLTNERGEVAEGTITNLFLESDDGVLLTPPSTSGCLPGIERETLLASGRARERTIMPEDLLAARALFVGNSLRGLVRAHFADGL